MKTNLTLTIDTRRTKKDGTFPIILRLSHIRKTTSISLGYSIDKEFWDDKNRRVKKTYKGVSSVNRFNNHLAKEKTNAMDIINGLAEKGELAYLAITQIKQKIIISSAYDSFFDFGKQLVEEMRKTQNIGNARVYAGTLQVFQTFVKGKDLKFNEINYDLLKRFELYHLANGNSVNGLSVYMRTIRAIYNKGIRAGLIEKEAYPFNLYKIRQEPTEKRAINRDQLKAIIELQLSENHLLFHSRNYFVLSYMMYGISFIDMAFLKVENIIDNRLVFRRKKTAKFYDINITEQMEEILSYYLQDKEKEDFIFPIIKRDSLELQYKDIKWARKSYNKRLKELGELCGIDQKLTSYVSRHSFATQAMLNEVPLTAISEMLGHSKLNTTQVYLKSLPTNILDTYQEKIISF